MTGSQTAALQDNSSVHARTIEGYDLPVIDVTQPRFAVPVDPQAAAALYAAFMQSELKRRRVPAFIMRSMLRSAAKKSRLARALFSNDTGFLDGLSTYVMKLGAGNLAPPYDTPMDQRLAASPFTTLLRLRTQQIATMVADGIVNDLADAKNAALHLINIGGGPAIDSINTLIIIARSRRELLQRKVVIHVLDGDKAGPFFGNNALTAMKMPGRPLQNLDIGFEQHAYNWDEPALLEDLVHGLISEGAIIAASSEGALFEYGSDAAIIGNLRALRPDGAGARLVAGSVTRADETRRRMIATTRFKLHMRGIEGFAPLAAKAGYSVAQSEAACLSDQVLLRPL
jgi:hypothetical protein